MLEEVKTGKTSLREAEKIVGKARRPRSNGLATGLAPGQWVDPPKPKPDSTLATRLIDGVNKGRGLLDLAKEVQEKELDLDEETIRALKARLDSEATARRKLSKALKAVLDRRNDTT